MNLDYESDRYKYIIIIAGGIGITPYISILEHIYELCKNKKLVNLKRTNVTWIMKDLSLYNDFRFFFDLYQKDISDFNIYVTQQKTEDDMNSYKKINIRMKRPQIDAIISKYMNYGINHSEIGVMCCGPQKLIYDTIDVCTKYDIELIHEFFSGN